MPEPFPGEGATLLVERAIENDGVQVRVEPQVGGCPLHGCDRSGPGAGPAILRGALGVERVHRLDEDARELAEEGAVLGQATPPREREGQDPLPQTGLRQEQLLPLRAAPRRDGQLELLVTARRSLRLARQSGSARHWLLFGRVARRWEKNPERAARRAVFRLISRAMPKPVRDATRLLRGLQAYSRQR